MSYPTYILRQYEELADSVAGAVKKHGEYSTNRDGFPKPHEVYGVLAEEVDELLDEIRAQKHDFAAVRKELMDIAATCMKAVLQIDSARPVGSEKGE